MECCIDTKAGAIEFILCRKRMKRVRIRVTGDLRVIVSAPHRLPQDYILEFVRENAQFVTNRLRETEKKRRACYPAGYKDGDMFLYLGEPIRLLLTADKKRDGFCQNGILWLYVPDGADYAQRRERFAQWSKKCAGCIFTARVQTLALGIPYVKNVRVSIKNMLTRWGSANAARHAISLSVHLLRCEPELIDYVILHELCHFAHQNHSAVFYRELETHCPGWRRLRKRLETYGMVDF